MGGEEGSVTFASDDGYLGAVGVFLSVHSGSGEPDSVCELSYAGVVIDMVQLRLVYTVVEKYLVIDDDA